MRLTLIVNPAASSVTPRSRRVIERALSVGHDLSVEQTTHKGHATAIAQEYSARGTDCVIVLSGDGTLNEVANALAGTGTALAALPGGSTNVFARTVGMTNDPIEATAILLEALAADQRYRIGLGSANGRYFLLNMGVGYDAAVVERAERQSWIKRWAGHPYFVLVGIFTWARSQSPREDPSFTVHFDGAEEVTSYFTLCLNSNPYTFVGNLPFDIAPDADFQKGFAVSSIKHLGFPTMAGVLFAALRSGRKVTNSASVDFRTNVSSFIVTNSTPFPYQVDGEYLGDVRSLTLRHHPQLLDVFGPSEQAYPQADTSPVDENG